MESTKKFRLTEEFKIYNGVELHRIEALKDFSNVKKGDKGGWVQHESNLSQQGNCWIYHDAIVYDCAIVTDNAHIYNGAIIRDNARVFDSAIISGHPIICDSARVCGNAKVYGNARICGNAKVNDHARVCGNSIIRTGVFN